MIKRLFPLLLVLSAQIAFAQPIIPSAPQIAAEAWLLIDAKTGEILTEHNSSERLPPASLTKMMTTFIVSDEIDAGRLNEDDEVLVSVNAWEKGGAKSGGSTMFLAPNSRVSVIDLMRGVIIQSGNDASIALAEHLAGSEEGFADVMNQRAEQLGMNGTHYMNATGLPQEGHYTTARDLAELARAMIEQHPHHYEIYQEKEFEHNGIKQPNRNQLLWRDSSVDGLKTGHTEEAGYCLVASAKRDDMRLISVVMGTDSMNARTTESQKLLTWGFRSYMTHQVYSSGDVLASEKVWKGRLSQVDLGVSEDIWLTIPRGDADALEAAITVDELMKAPIEEGQQMGRLRITYRGEELLETALVAKQTIPESGFFARMWDGMTIFFLKLFGKL